MAEKRLLQQNQPVLLDHVQERGDVELPGLCPRGLCSEEPQLRPTSYNQLVPGADGEARAALGEGLSPTPADLPNHGMREGERSRDDGVVGCISKQLQKCSGGKGNLKHL